MRRFQTGTGVKQITPAWTRRCGPVRVAVALNWRASGGQSPRLPSQDVFCFSNILRLYAARCPRHRRAGNE
ncbi:unnamed protein product [Merluccius merluccius]